MAATGKTPILLYGSTTATNQPSAGNLTNSSDGCEIAINVADKNLFFKDATNTVNTVPIRQSSASSDGWLSSTDWSTFNSKQPAGSYLTSVTVDAPLTGAGTSGSHLSIPAASGSTNGYLTSADWTTFNSKQPAGTYVTSVTGTAPVVSSGGTTPAISMAAATGSVNGYLTSTDWTTFNNKAPAFTYTSGYIPFGQGTTTPNQSSSLYWDNGNHRLGIGTTSPRNGIDCNTAIYSNQFLAVTRPVDNGIATGPCVVIADSNTSHQWIVQMGASDQLFSWLYNGSSWLNPFTISATSQLNLTGTGQGIQFGSSSVLNDYEEGTWTPSISTSGGAVTSYTSSGTYVKIGKTVTVTFNFTVTDYTGGSGTGIIGNLPYSASTAAMSGTYRESAVNGAIHTLMYATTTSVYSFAATAWATGAVGSGSFCYITS